MAIILQSCTLIYREIRYGEADITDHKIFPYTKIKNGENNFHFKKGDSSILDNYMLEAKDSTLVSLDKYLEKTSTTSFIVIRNDSILFEKYYHGYKRNDVSTLFSVSKSVTSMLAGIAVDEGYIKSLNDPVTKYIPELNDCDERFKRLSIEHLLNMRSGIDFNENYDNYIGKMPSLYYGTNQLAKIKKYKFKYEPGEKHEYQSGTTAILGIVLERATGKNLGKYLEEKVWKTMGMEYDAKWSLDDKRHNSTKSYCGLATTPIDLAKIGRLYLNKGDWNGKQILSKDWVEKSTTPIVENDGEQYNWYNINASLTDNGSIFFPDSLAAENAIKKTKYKQYTIWQDEYHNNDWRANVYIEQFFALGIMKQVLYVDPKKNLIMVRLGEGGDLEYPSFMYTISRKL